jgi:hypothetical protein
MPLACLESYIRTIRSQVSQPVTADDDWTFYAGKSWAGGDRVEVKPDTILPLIDFASIHMYPISNAADWNWRQTGAEGGPERARAMMEESLRVAKANYDDVARYQYRGAAGVAVSVADSMPIVIGETGWKAVQTNPASEIESYAARPENQKWYVDLLYGGNGYPSWERSAGGPPTIFYFEATDEAWKGIDDGWGLWDESRTARYALCGTPAGPLCNADVYAGAGYYSPPPFETITFDDPDVTYSLTGFAGAEDSQVVADPENGANKVARVLRSATADTFAGTVVSTVGDTVGILPFDSDNTRMTVRVYSPGAGIPVRLKVETSGNSSQSVETEATTTVANGWETLTFDFANPATGPALNPSFTYDKVIIFFNFDVLGSVAGAQTYYFDDVTFIGGGGIGSGPLVFVSGYATNNLTVEGGAWGYYSDNFTDYANTFTGGAYVDGANAVPAADSYVYLVVTTSAPTTAGFMGIYTVAGTSAGITLSGQTALKIELAIGAQWFEQAGNKALTVRLIGAEVYSDDANGTCQTWLDTPLTPTSVDLATYTVDLAGMTLAKSCNDGGFNSGVTTVAEALARPIGELHVQAVYPQVNTTVLDGAEYPTGFTRGAAWFE